jgi:hypothetical protein
MSNPGHPRRWTGNEEPRLDELLDDATMGPLLQLWRLDKDAVRAEMRGAAARLRQDDFTAAA